ncbi:hypothetical protein H257_05830 [Aphanomyces astaci]|uniref:DDE Tnp4 domain-containing protein n=1 Tax=Aphanomyces astaci TaxID=112090 RepID=W4GNI9_APHAT|nr:hypothetical protein H257_05830 [Aphanomyces astaci]ETV81267.1 hypothetical protein H257_05830 [Aphanomyces astaci]|eukprot:XP_009829125.1 hypothetical protein H257_05830 [Aphanomyces astaci]
MVRLQGSPVALAVAAVPGELAGMLYRWRDAVHGMVLAVANASRWKAIESRALIKDQSEAAWYTMYESRSIPSFIATKSIPPDDFDDLLRVFSVNYTVCSGPGRRERPPRVQQTHAVLAMLLHYYTAAVEHKTLQELFGVSPTTFSRVLRRAEVALDRALSHMQDSAVRWPSKALQRDWAVLTNAKEPLMEGVFAFVDGKNYRVQSPSNADLQNAHYNGMLPVLAVANASRWKAIESRALIKDQSEAAWYTMYESRSIPSFIATKSIPPDDFDDLLRVFSVNYTVCSGPGRRERPPRVQQTHAVLAMLLHYYTAAVEHKTLQELFGVSPTTFSRVLRRAEVALDRALSHMQDSAVRWPSKALQRDWAVLTNAKEPLMEGVFAFVDGKNYRVQSPSNADLQNAHYNGSWNDGEVSCHLQARVSDERFVAPGMKIASVSAFPVSGRCSGRIITPLKEGDLDRNPPCDRLALQTMSDCITSLRQAAEWGMGATGKVYRQLLLPLPYNPLVRGRRLSNMFQLYNFRVRRTGLSQIKNVFGA